MPVARHRTAVGGVDVARASWLQREARLHPPVRQTLYRVVWAAVALTLLGCSRPQEDASGSPGADTGTNEAHTTSPDSSATAQPAPGGVAGSAIAVGIEYAFPGTASVFAETGMQGAKPFPEGFTRWGKMQPDLAKPVDFGPLDALVREYQEAGLTDLTFGLRYDHGKASVNATTGGAFLGNANSQPRPEYLEAFDAWLRAMVERYDGDGVDDMPGLVAGVEYWELGVEYSSYVPESGSEYVSLLERAFRVMHEAGGDAIRVAHAAFLVAGPIEGVTDPSEYPAAIAGGPAKIRTKRYDEIELILSRPDLTDVWNIHSLGDPSEIDHLVRWLRWEEEQRGISPKPIIVSDTSASPYVAFGIGTTCTGPLHAIPIYPATAADHCRIADYFKALVDGDAEAEAFARKQTAEDSVKKIVIAASDGVLLINSAFTEDIDYLKGGVLGLGIPAGAGFGGWAGILDVHRNAATQQRTVKGRYPGFYAMRQLLGWLEGYTSLRRVDTGDDRVRLYSIERLDSTSWIAWFDPKAPVLPGDAVSYELALPDVKGKVVMENLLSGVGEKEPVERDGVASRIVLSDTPVFITRTADRRR